VPVFLQRALQCADKLLQLHVVLLQLVAVLSGTFDLMLQAAESASINITAVAKAHHKAASEQTPQLMMLTNAHKRAETRCQRQVHQTRLDKLGFSMHLLEHASSALITQHHVG
jgi:hypothetical protein